MMEENSNVKLEVGGLNPPCNSFKGFFKNVFTSFGCHIYMVRYCYLNHSFHPETPGIHAKVLIGSGVAVFALPFIFVTNGSLFSKLLPQHIQGMYVQSVIWIALIWKSTSNCSK